MEWTTPVRPGRPKTMRRRAARLPRVLLVLAAGGGFLAAALSGAAQEPPATYRPSRATVQMGSGPVHDVGSGLRVPGRPPARASAVIESAAQPDSGSAPLPPGHDATRAVVTFEAVDSTPPPQVVIPAAPTPTSPEPMPVRAEFPAARKTDVPQVPVSTVIPEPVKPQPTKPVDARSTMRTTVIEGPVNPTAAKAETPKAIDSQTPKSVSPTIVQDQPKKAEPPSAKIEAPKPIIVQEQSKKPESPAASKPAASKPGSPATVHEQPKKAEPPATAKSETPKPPGPTIVQEQPRQAETSAADKSETPKPASTTTAQKQPVKAETPRKPKGEAPKTASSMSASNPPAKAATSPVPTPIDKAAAATRSTPQRELSAKVDPLLPRAPESTPAPSALVHEQPVKVAPPSAPNVEPQSPRPTIVQQMPAKVEPASAPKAETRQTTRPTVAQEPSTKPLPPTVPNAFKEPARSAELTPSPKSEVQRPVRQAAQQDSGPKMAPRATKPDVQQPVRTAAFQEPVRQDPVRTEVMPAPRSSPRPLQTPSVIDPFNPTRIRLPRLGYDGGGGRPRHHGDPTPSGPQLSEEEMKEYAQFVQEMVDPRSTLDLIVGRPRLMILKEVPVKMQIGDEEIAGYQLIGPRQISLLARRTGTTVLNMWFTDPQDKTKERILSYLVRVLPDPDAKARLEQIYKALADEINEAFPDSLINITLVGDKLVVSGQAKDIAEATQILRIVRSQAPDQETAQIPFQNVQVAFAPEDVRDMRDFFLAGGPNVINLIRVPGEQQVMLRVTVAEVNRAAARSIGLNFTIANNSGVTVFSQLTGDIAGSGFNNLPVALDNGQINLAINALRTLNFAQSLAEPVLTTMNGQTATFQAGGQFPVPVVTGFTASGLQGVSFVPFGVLLNFTPYITDKDRIRLNVSAEVSTRDLESGANINNTQVPGLNTRNFQTTVELREGQTLCVAGLLQQNQGAQSDRVPLFGDLPVLGRLASFDRLTSGEQELVILITPELVHPLEPDELMPLPGSDIVEPGDLEFYLLGRLESRREYDYRTPVRTDLHRMLRYRHCEDVYIYGPKGHSSGPVINLSELQGPKPLNGHHPLNVHHPVPGHFPGPGNHQEAKTYKGHK